MLFNTAAYNKEDMMNTSKIFKYHRVKINFFLVIAFISFIPVNSLSAAVRDDDDALVVHAAKAIFHSVTAAGNVAMGVTLCQEKSDASTEEKIDRALRSVDRFEKAAQAAAEALKHIKISKDKTTEKTDRTW